MPTKKYYLRATGEHVDRYNPIAIDWASPEMYQLIYETACRALTFQTLLLSTRARNCLERNKIDSMWELKHLNRAAIRRRLASRMASFLGELSYLLCFALRRGRIVAFAPRWPMDA